MAGRLAERLKTLLRSANPAISRAWEGTLRDRVYARLIARDCSLNAARPAPALDIRTERLQIGSCPIHTGVQDGTQAYVDYLTDGRDAPVDRAVGVHVLTGGRLSYPPGVISGRDGIVVDAYPNPSALHNPKYAFAQMAQPYRRLNSRHTAGFPLYVAWGHNFFHWTVDMLTRLTFLDAVPREVPVVLFGGAPGFVKQSMDLLGLDREVLWLGPGTHGFDTLYVASNLATPSIVSGTALDYLRGPWRAALGGASAPDGPSGERLYISRKDAGSRRIANEPEVEAMLRRHGFRSITMSEHSLAEQAALFARADAVVGSHGAAFINLAYAQPGTKVIEIFREGFRSRSFYSIADQLGLNYGLMLSKADASGDLVVRTDVLEELLTRMLGTAHGR